AAPVREWLLRRVEAKPGDTVLELAAGAGDTGLQVAATLGENGRLISTDFTPEMVDAARRHGAEAGLTNVEYRVMDAQSMDLEDDSVDRVICRFGYMLMADPAKALFETRRVLRPGRRLALAVWGPPGRNPWAGIGAMTLVQRGHMPQPDPSVPGVFYLGDTQLLRSLLEGAGFDSIDIEEVPVHFDFADVEDYVSMMSDTAGPIAMVIRSLPDDELQATKAQLGSAFASFATDGGYDLPGLALAAVAS
ncbi:MAG TPA: methyltransferase domain-containing protein, partial [Dehalococcoidia bacterium]|nr:methyltransferase domain-containing protein [Dehalococcoidia bacterium]